MGETSQLTLAQAQQEVVDTVAVARLYGEPLFALPQDLYIPPDAQEILLEAFEGPLDLLLYLIRKQNLTFWIFPWRRSRRNTSTMWKKSASAI